jgi:RNA polymerase sigma factor (sigma-70 family)
MELAQRAHQETWFSDIPPAERTRLVRYFARQTGDADAAEDLTQETLIEAWRHADRLIDADAHERWLFGIARNVGRRWARAHGRERARQVTTDAVDLDGLPGDDEDINWELEREDLAGLLDRALAELPETTRTLLLQHYIDELPQAELAQKVGLSEGAVAVRIHRGKMTLRRLLEHDEPAEGEDRFAWQETRIWCPHCGMRKLWGRFGPNNTSFSLYCPDCHPTDKVHVVNGEHTADELAGITTYKPAFNRVMEWAIGFYRPGLTTGTVNCHRCGRPTQLHRHLPDTIPLPWRDEPGVHFRCTCHDEPFDAALSALTLWLPEGRLFWRAHPRIRRLPTQEIDFAGRAAVVTTYQSLTDSAEFAAISDRDTLELLGIA